MSGDNMTDKHGIAEEIAAIGSIEWQRYWVVNGSVERGYAELDEHIETTIYEAKRQATHLTTRDKYSEHEREVLIRFHDRVDALYGLIPWRDSKVSITDIVERNETMQQIRDAANECLRELGVSFTTEELVND
jgi:hypothetical protein